MHAFWLSLAVIFVAELGDKSQLMALAFATRYRTLPVLIGITTATALVHLFSVVIGDVLGSAIPEKPIAIVAAISFLFLVYGHCVAMNSPLATKNAPQYRPSTSSLPSEQSFSYQSLAIKQCWRQSHWQLVMASGDLAWLNCRNGCCRCTCNHYWSCSRRTVARKGSSY